jgi:hypothetical protein
MSDNSTNFSSSAPILPCRRDKIELTVEILSSTQNIFHIDLQSIEDLRALLLKYLLRKLSLFRYHMQSRAHITLSKIM